MTSNIDQFDNVYDIDLLTNIEVSNPSINDKVSAAMINCTTLFMLINSNTLDSIFIVGICQEDDLTSLATFVKLLKLASVNS